MGFRSLDLFATNVTEFSEKPSNLMNIFVSDTELLSSHHTIHTLTTDTIEFQ